jgi:catechol 2,3-dioxygenase-like lactoylglutathione lyase family enzyme
MQLIDHVSISVRDIDRAKRFYTAVLSTLGAVVAYDREDAIGFGERNRPDDDGHTYLTIYRSREAASDSRRHWSFRAQSREQVNAFHAAGLADGGKDAGAPGLRSYHPQYYAAFLFDPEGNKVEAVYHQAAV